MDLSNENVVHVKKNGIEYLQFRRLLEYSETINHAYSLGIDKNYRIEKSNKSSMENYKNLCELIGCNYINIVKPNQQHTNNVEIVLNKQKVNEPDIQVEKYQNTDGLITNKKNMVLATTNADCILMIFFDPVKKVISNIHSSWKGTLQRISVKTVEKMQKEFECKPENIICCMAPSIRKCHFEVEKDVKNQFIEEFQDIKENWIEESKLNEKWNIDTIKINKILLEKKGLKSENIIDSKICSVCNSELIHSYRVEKEGYGLNTLLVELNVSYVKQEKI